MRNIDRAFQPLSTPFVGILPGLALVGVIAALALWAAEWPWIKHWGLGALTLSIVMGIVLGNTFFTRIADTCAEGVNLAKGRLLRLGVILFGFRISFQQIMAIGWAGVLIDVLVLVCTFLLALGLGRWLRLDRQTTVLIGAGSAICGAAAIMATSSTIGARASQVSVAVATVVIFGTISMFLYPLLAVPLGLSDAAFGLYAGSTIHEVAQVVAAGSAMGEEAAATAVITKMLRVMMLAPFLLILASWGQGAKSGGRGMPAMPWFALLFIAVAAIHSLQVLPEALVDAMIQLDNLLLAMAMAALGLQTQVTMIRQAGFKPLVLAAMLFAFLLIGGYAINWGVSQVLA